MSCAKNSILTGLTVVVAMATFNAAEAYADDSAPPPDKSGYTLFNPVPDDQMRSFSTDRPTKSDTPYTVDAGHFQYEADIANWTYDRYNAAHTVSSNLLIGDPTLKMGLTQNTDLEMALTPISIGQTQNLTTGVKTNSFGFGDVYTRLKYNVLGNDGGDYALAIVPYVKAPTATHNIGNNHWEGGGYAPFVMALPQNWTMNITSELDILENSALNGDHANFQNLINFSHTVFNDKVTGYVEFWSDVNDDVAAPTQYTLDFATSWLVTDNWQIDTGVNIGLNKASNDIQPYLGISQRF